MALLNSEIDSELIHRFSHKAMATIYELMIESEDKSYTEQVAKAAFEEVDRLEQELSRFLPNSEISLINSLMSGDSVILSEDTLICLSQSLKLYELTNGAFDISLGRFKDGKNLKIDQTSHLQEKFELNVMDHTITVKTDELNIDLGGFGKGYALDKVCDLLLEWDIENAIIHGGGSSVKSIGKLSGYNGWPITISNPVNSNQTIANLLLENISISASGIKKGDHIINPLNTRAIIQRNAAWAISKTAAYSDALSTAFMIMKIDEILKLCATEEGIDAIIVEEGKSEIEKSDIIISDSFNYSNLTI